MGPDVDGVPGDPVEEQLLEYASDQGSLYTAAEHRNIRPQLKARRQQHEAPQGE